MMSLATNRRILTKPEKRVFTRPPNPPKQPVTPRYLHSKKTNSNKVSGPTANATPFPALKRRPFKKDTPEILKNEIKKTSDNQHALKPDNVSVESSMNEMHSFKVISDISEISSPGIQSNIGKPVSKYAAEQYEKSSPHSNSNPYNPNQFSSNVQQVKQKPTENKKLVVEEIQKNLKKWRIQRDTKAKENVNTHLDTQNVTSDKTSFICTEVNKFNPEEKPNNDRTNVNEEPNVNDNKKISESHDFSVQVNLNGDNHDTSNAAKNLQTKTLYEKTAIISKDCNYNTDSHNEKPIKTDGSNPSNLKNEDTDFRPTINEISNIGTDKKTKKKNDVHNIEHSRSESEVIQNSVLQSSGDVLDSMTKNHKKCLYALVDTYLTKTKTNPNKSMENFMKYMLSNLGPSNTEEQTPSSMSKENSMPVQMDTLEEDKSKTHDNTDLKKDENKSDDQCSLENKVVENSHLGKIQSKEKYLKKLSTEKFKSKYLEESHNKEANSNSTIIIPNVSKENSVLSKKDKFKQLTLISSKQNENMYIHINYQSHTGPLGKSKLTIHKESHIDIRPQLTKHTFTTATCMPRVHSSKPNISTHYLVHLNEGGCKEIDPDSEEIPQDSFSFPSKLKIVRQV
uniref:Uncharacterized protein n=1 Tax=Cacopsylla melanoneura TaxID=428564 RepID=A0A8D8ZPN8_9HEMI